jgi:hypothetical protein
MYSPSRSPCTSTSTVAAGVSIFFMGEEGVEEEEDISGCEKTPRSARVCSSDLEKK